MLSRLRGLMGKAGSCDRKGRPSWVDQHERDWRLDTVGEPDGTGVRESSPGLDFRDQN